MASVVESVDVNVPVSTAYNQWTQFEDFPRFMEGVKLVKQLDDTHLHWARGDRRHGARSGMRRSPSSIPTNEWHGRSI